MQQLTDCKSSLIEIAPLEPLWKRVPTRDDEGQLLGDFMMLIPGLNKLAIASLQTVIARLEQAFSLYHQYVVFVDLNPDKNVLWVSHRPAQSIGLELAAVIHELIPEARLVAQRYE